MNWRNLSLYHIWEDIFKIKQDIAKTQVDLQFIYDEGDDQKKIFAIKKAKQLGIKIKI